MAQEVALITGASSGIGEALARRIARDGRAVALVARRLPRLESIAAELRAKHRVDVHTLPADLTAPGAIPALVDEVGRRGLTVDWLVNNAGFGTFGKFHEMPLAKELEEIRLNVEALVELTGRFVPGMVARKRGVVMNIASVGSFVTRPGVASYPGTDAVRLR